MIESLFATRRHPPGDCGERYSSMICPILSGREVEQENPTIPSIVTLQRRIHWRTLMRHLRVMQVLALCELSVRDLGEHLCHFLWERKWQKETMREIEM